MEKSKRRSKVQLKRPLMLSSACSRKSRKSLLHRYRLATINNLPRNRSTPSLPIPTSLVAIHAAPLRASAQFSICCRADWSAVGVPSSAALLEGQQLLGTEGLVVNLRSGFDQILQMSAGKEVSKVDEFAVVFVLDIDNSPSVLASTNLLSSNDDWLF